MNRLENEKPLVDTAADDKSKNYLANLKLLYGLRKDIVWLDQMLDTKFAPLNGGRR